MTFMFFLDCFCDDEQYRDTNAMNRLLDCRQEEVDAVYHDKSLVDALITMCHNLQKHPRGISFILNT